MRRMTHNKKKMKPLLFLIALLVCLGSISVAVKEDQEPRCKEWAANGECSANPGYMLHNCATSCYELDKADAAIREKLDKVGSFYDLFGRDIDGNAVNFSDFKGKVVVIVNVASECGYTESHYRGLVELFNEVGGTGAAEILAYPCNQFGSQEPGTAQEIKDFARSKGVKFRMMEKIDVNGAGADLVYLYLKDQAGIKSITWNFATYFVVSPEGEIESYTGVEPMELSNIIQLLQKDEL